jgi:hypothetical protein
MVHHPAFHKPENIGNYCFCEPTTASFFVLTTVESLIVLILAAGAFALTCFGGAFGSVFGAFGSALGAFGSTFAGLFGSGCAAGAAAASDTLTSSTKKFTSAAGPSK